MDADAARSSELGVRHGRVRGGAGRRAAARWSGPTRSARRSSRCRAPPTGAWRWRASGALEKRTGNDARPTSPRSTPRRADHLRGHPDPAAQGDRLGRVVGHGEPRAPLLAVHDQHRARGALPHAHRPPALLRGPPVDARVRRGPAGLPAAAQPGPPPRGPQGIDDGVAEVTLRYLTPHSKWSIHSTYQDNLHMLTLFRGGPVIWMSPHDAERIGVRRQRLGGGLQPQRRRGLPGGGLPPHPRGHLADVPRPGPAHQRAALRGLGHPRGHPQLAHPDQRSSRPT